MKSYPYESVTIFNGTRFVIGDEGVIGISLGNAIGPFMFIFIAYEDETRNRTFMCTPTAFIVECGIAIETPDELQRSELILPHLQVPEGRAII